MSSTQVVLLALCSNMCFGTASFVFTQFSKRFSPFWMNQLKVSVAFIAFCLAMAAAENWIPLSNLSAGALLLSGILGLCIGDIFIFRAYTTLGPARSLVLYSFQPLILGVYAYFVLAQGFSWYEGLAVICMIACVLIFVLERNRNTGHWDYKSFMWAFFGICFDAGGIMLTRYAYENTPDMGSFQTNAIRAFGALVGFLLLRPKSYGVLLDDLRKMPRTTLFAVVGACLIGTFLSLALYLRALKFAHLATLSAVTITSPILIASIDCIRAKKWPNKYLSTALALFVCGVFLFSFGGSVS